MSKFFQKNQRGFSIIELLTVIAIIGILSSMVQANFLGVKEKARDIKRLYDINNIIKEMEIYEIMFDEFPGKNDEGGIHISPRCESEFTSDLIRGGYTSHVPGSPADKYINCDDNSPEADFYGWYPDHECGGRWCVSINRIETDWVGKLLENRFGACNAEDIGAGDEYVYCEIMDEEEEEDPWEF